MIFYTVNNTPIIEHYLLGGVFKILKKLPNYYKGHVGFYSNNLIYNTLARKYGLPHKALHPELIRKIRFNNGLQFDSNKKFIVSDSNLLQQFLNGRTNFTIDRPVVSHTKGSWDDMDAIILNPKVLKSRRVKSIEPSDFIVEGDFHVDPKDVVLISGNKKLLNLASDNKITTLSSKKLKRLYNQMLLWKDNYNKLSFTDKLYAGKLSRLPIAKLYSDEIQRLLSLRGTPTIKDINYLENLYNLKSGAIPIKNKPNYENLYLDFKKIDLNDLDDIKSASKHFVYPNGRIMEIYNIPKEIKLINRSKYNNLFYDPSTYVDSILYQ